MTSHGKLGPSSSSVEATQQWIIEGFSTLPSALGQQVLSPRFAAAERFWRFVLCPGGDNDPKFVSFFVNLEGAEKNPLRAKVEIAIVSAETRYNCRSFEYSWSGNDDRGFQRYLERTELTSEGLMKDDCVTFEVKFKGTMSLRLPNVQAPNSFAFAELLESGLLSDVTLLCEGEEIRAHKAILAARSPVFKAMFAHKMSESLEGKVLIDDMRASELRQLLQFMYCGVLPDGSAAMTSSDVKDSQQEAKMLKQRNPPDLIQLWSAADRFQVAALVDLCATRLSESLEPSNVLERLMFADRHNVEKLKQGCIDYVRADSKRLIAMMKDERFADLEAAQLALILSAFLPAGEKWAPKTASKKRERPADLAADPDMQPPSKDAIKRMKTEQLAAALKLRRLDAGGSEAEMAQRLLTAIHGDPAAAVASSSTS